MPMRKLGKIRISNKVLIVSVIVFVVLCGAYYLTKELTGADSRTMTFTKKFSPVPSIPEKIPEEEVPPTEWEDVVPEENFDWKVPPLPELPQGHNWKVIDPTATKPHAVKKMWFSNNDHSNWGGISPTGTLYYSGVLKYDSDFLKNLGWFSKGLDLDWKHSVLYEGTKFYVDGGGATGSSFMGLVKSNGFLIRSITITELLRGNLEMYIYISDTVNMNEYISAKDLK